MTLALHGKSKTRQTWLMAIAVAMVAFAALAGGALSGGGSARAAGGTVVVKPSTMNGACQTVAVPNYCFLQYPSGWLFYNDQTDQGDPTLGSFVTGPGVPAGGVGSAQISVTGAQRRNLATYQFAGTPLASITTLAFSTYNPSAGNGGSSSRSAYLQFNVDFNGSDTWQKRLTFVPSTNAPVTQNAWKEWNAINGGNALWTYSGAAWPTTLQSGTTPKTWAQILLDYPAARVRVTDAQLSLRVGEPYADGYTENIDSLKFGTAAGTTTYDFEPETPCTTVCYANSATGNDAFGGDSPTSAKKTIQAAVNQVSPGGTVIAAAGSYSENVSIAKALLLKGAKASMPVGGRTFPNASESTITGQVTIQAARVTIDGVAVTNPGQSMGILVKTAGDYARIQNTIVDTVGGPGFAGGGGAQGIYLEYGPDNVSVLKSRITNIQSDLSAKAIFIGDSTSANPSLNILIKGNTLSNIKSNLKGAYGVQVNNGSSTAPSATGYTTLRVTNNTLSSFVGNWAHAIGLEGDTPVAVIEGNVISGVVDTTPTPFNDAIAVWFEDNPSFALAQVHRNAFNIGSTAYGIVVHPALTGGLVSGTCNWWGAKDGPGVVGPGSGALVGPNVTFSPWLKSANLNGKCEGDDNDNGGGSANGPSATTSDD